MNEARPPALDRDAAAALIEPLTDIVIRAGAAILAVNRSAMKVDGKTDGSPVTEADLAADRIIAEGLAQVAPDIPSLSEERVRQATLPYKESFFLIDPLDGTKEFVAGRNEFTVNLALVTHGTPLLGIVSAPALGLIWRGIVGRGAERLTLGKGKPLIEPVRTRPCPPRGQPWTVAVSRSHGDARTEAFIAARPGAVRCELGSAVKFGRVAEGGVDIYPRLSPTSEWDVAAGQAVVAAAGGRITDSSGAALVFGTGRRTSSFRNSSPGAIRTRRPERVRSPGERSDPGSGARRMEYVKSSPLFPGSLRSPGLRQLANYCASPRSSAGQRAAASFRKRCRLGGERIAVFLAAEQIEPLARDHPKARVARIGHPSSQIDRVVAAELRPVDLRMRHERGAVALVAETPDGAGFAGLEVGQPLGCHGFREIGDGIEALDGEPGIAVHHHPLGGRGPTRQNQG